MLAAMTIKERYRFAIEYFEHTMPDAKTELHYRSPYELLVAVMLSAQCTDKRVNMTTPAFFSVYPTAEQLSKAEFDDVFPLIKSISYPNSKTKHLIAMAQMLVKDFKGKVPGTIEDLEKLPGVGHKTANVIASVVFGENTMPVDTHVFRVAQRIGLVKPSKTPLQVETQLLKNIPPDLTGKFHHWLILHGRYVCVARNPKCDICGLKAICVYYKKHPITSL
jgi:endonuclease-3